MRRSSSVALGGGKVTRRDSEHKIEVRTEKTRHTHISLTSFLLSQASVIESEYTSSASGTD